MLHARVIPCLLLSNGGLVKTVRFKNPTYVGDPINAIKIFNEKEVDELFFLDIKASKENRKPNLDILYKIASECFMPIAYGGGITSLRDIKNIISIGIEKVVISTKAIEDPQFIRKAADMYGSSTIGVCIDYKKVFLRGTRATMKGGRKISKYSPLAFAELMQEMGAGEIVLNSIDRDGTMNGYDRGEIEKISRHINTPVVALGGAGKIADLKTILNETKASAVAAGSIFVFHGQNKAVLISYPDKKIFNK